MQWHVMIQVALFGVVVWRSRWPPRSTNDDPSSQ
jgi:hypothetical protein